MLIGSAIAVLVFMAAVMTAAWVFSLGVRNGGWTDVFWTFGTGAALAGAAIWPVPPTERQWLAAALVAVWSLRLGFYVARRVAGHGEDARYAHFREEWGKAYPRNMLFLSLPQAPATALLSISIILAAHRDTPGLDLRDAAAVLILAIAIGGEALADTQMRRFKANPDNKGKVCDTGLWAWSRHPNYFFEWLGWLAWPAMGLILDQPLTWLTFTGPVVMYVLLTRISGVPPLEDAMLRSKGEAYRAYQARTSAFFPLPPRTP